jgi:hypothetical protein
MKTSEALELQDTQKMDHRFVQKFSSDLGEISASVVILRPRK